VLRVARFFGPLAAIVRGPVVCLANLNHVRGISRQSRWPFEMILHRIQRSGYRPGEIMEKRSLRERSPASHWPV